MATTLFFSSLSSQSLLRRNPNLSTASHLYNFSPISISIRTNSRKSSKPAFCVSASAVRLASIDAPEAPETAVRGGGGGASLEISELGISDEIVSALVRRGITQLFPIQRAVLEPAMEGRDMIGRAITGSGKTLAFGIPILDKILRHQTNRRQKRVPSALILAPTRELARQVQKELKESAPNLSSACLYGGVPIMEQARALRLGIDIAVGTPGRIIDLVERGALNLSEIKFVVLDEADQMLAVGFQEDVECILSYLPAKKQCMLFSATMPSWVNDLSKKYLRDPLVVDLVGDSDQKLANGISLYSVQSTSSGKENILPQLVSKYGKGGKSIIFTKTKKDAEELSKSIGSILASRALHGNMQQFQRDRTLSAFRSGRFSVLVATDVAARGLDIPNVDLVIHFEIPNTSEIFVHRSGRTGRAGKKGTAVLIYTKAQRRAVNFIERDLGFKFEELPRITADREKEMGNMGDNEGRYERYGSPMSGLGYYDNFSEGQSGSYRGSSFRSSGKTRNQFSKGSKNMDGYTKDRGSSQRTNLLQNQGVQNSHSSYFNRTPRLQTYEDSEISDVTEKNASERKQDRFQQILDMLSGQT
ncbi:hypothetical protein Sjap_017241 [Stephania japonica]|uniref:Uncharacterized protein n=1 Tax=Stephania japonica TaxID=461633 RepID=A0AAP0NLR9_9MAGN